MKSRGIAIIKTEACENRTINKDILTIIECNGFRIVRILEFLMDEKDFDFLRRDSLRKSYIDELRFYYLYKIHQLLILEVLIDTGEDEFFRKSTSIKASVRSKYTINYLINGIHIPTRDEFTEEYDYFTRKL
jgi:hypothetical protein